jgi:hypothetical protein
MDIEHPEAHKCRGIPHFVRGDKKGIGATKKIAQGDKNILEVTKK